MTAIAPITCEDAAATPPWTYTLNPQQINGNLATFLDTVGGVPLGFPKLTASLTRPSKGNRYSRVRLRMVDPVLETLAGANSPSLAYENFFDLTFSFHERSTTEDRQRLHDVMLQLAEALGLNNMIVDLETLY